MTKAAQMDEKDITQIPITKLSSAFNKEGIIPDKGWFSKVSDIFGKLTDIIANPKNLWQKAVSLYSDMVAGATAGAAAGGVIGGFFGGIGAIPGAIVGGAIGGIAGALGRPLSGLLRFGKDNAAVVTNAAKVAGALGTMGVLGGITGQSMPQLIRNLLNWGDVLYDFNWDMPDSQIWGAIKKTIDGLYGQAGSFLGASFARLILLGTVAPPKIVVDVRGLSLVYSELGQDQKNDLLNGVTSFAKLGITAVKKIGFLIAFMTGRKALKAYFKAAPELKQLDPKLYKTVTEEWGNEEDPNTAESEVKDWKISTKVEQKLENVKEVFGDQIGDFVENFFEEFSDTLRDGLEDWADSLELQYT